MIGGIVTFAVQTGKIIKLGTEWYAGMMITTGNQKNIDNAQNEMIVRQGARLNVLDSASAAHEHRIGISEMDINMLQLHEKHR